MDYSFLLSTPNHWKNVGIKRRAGIIAPLFSIWSEKSLGIGKIPDLKLLIDWSRETGNTILQLLPINDTGFDVSPYSLQSSFALNPIYLSIPHLTGIQVENRRINDLAKKFPILNQRVNYQIKGEKLKFLWEIFSKNKISSENFENFIKKNNYWLKDYCLFRLLKEKFKERKWEDWPEDFRNRKKESLLEFEKEHQKEIKFQQWLQWQLFEQLIKIKKYAKEKGVLLKGDLPWLISRDSADVWAKREYFDLNFSAGAPPDMFSKKGQNWIMPPIKWEEIFADNFDYFKKKLKYAENFYNLLRIDHIIGIFRIWKISISEPLKNKGLNGAFSPQDLSVCASQGKKILLEILKNTKMLICGEDLGIIPPGCPKILKELGIPGILVERWVRNWETKEFIAPENYDPLSVATLSTHDTSLFLDWWENEANKKEKKNLLKIIFKTENVLEEELILKNLEKVQSSNSIFCILLLMEWLFLEKNLFKKAPASYRLNLPGKVSKKNWAIKMPISLEKLLKISLNQKIKKIIYQTNRN